MELRFGQLSDVQRSREQPAEASPFRIAIFGDFTGRANRAVQASSDELAAAKPFKAQFDALEDLLGQLAPKLSIVIADGSTVELRFTEFDDFHPDGIYRQVDAVQGLKADEASPIMRSILHAADFRTVESSWRGLEWLLRRTSKNSNVLVRVFDCSADEFLADLRSNEELSRTGSYRTLVANDEGKELPWAAVVALYQFDMTAEHSELLGRLATIGYQLNAPVLSNLDSRVAAADFAPDIETKSAWESLTALPVSAFLQLAAPRFLLRMPYGANYKPCDAFDFEEFSLGEVRDQGAYLWGNPALLSSCLLAREYMKSGWQFTPGGQLQLESMPLHAYRTADDDEMAVSTEARFSSTVGEQLAAWGLSAVLPVRGRDLVELSALRSVSSNSPTLAGAWNAGGGVQLAGANATPATTDVSTTEFAGDDGGTSAIDDELAALLAGTDSPPANDTEPSELDAELAALLAGADPEPVTEIQPMDETDSSNVELDAELAALLGGGDSPAAESEAPVELDPELAALLGEAAQPDSASDPIADLDAELAALMADTPASEPVSAEDPAPIDDIASDLATTVDNTADDDPLAGIDPELAALMADLGGDTAADITPKVDSAVTEFSLDADLAALLGESSTSGPGSNGNTELSQGDSQGTDLPPSTPQASHKSMSMSVMATDIADVDELIRQAQEASKYGLAGSPPVLDFKALLQPISDDNPAGESVPFSMREELEQARKEINPESFRADDPMRPTDWVRADWSKVISLTQEILTERSKNLLVAARLLEALTKKHGFAGARDGLHLMRLLIEVCWDRLEPAIEDDDLEVRAGPFNWLDDADRGSCYPFTIKQAPLIFAGEVTYSWIQWNQGGSANRGPEEIEKAIATTTREQCQLVADDVSQTLTELKWLVQSLRQKIGPDAPGLAAIRPGIEECRALALQILQKKGPAPIDATADSAGESSNTGNGQAAAPRLNSRGAIYAQLAEAADALQRLEPHSPVPFLILRAVELGGLPFPQLMAALIRDSSVLSEMKRELGIKADE